MTGRVSRFLAEDHTRLDALLDAALDATGGIDLATFGAFREGLLRHIAWEEKILLPAWAAARAGEPHPLARRLRIDHGALAALLVPTPTAATIGELRKILVPHDDAEEGPDGLYETCEATLPAAEREALVERMRAYPPVKVARYHDGPRVCRTADEALRISALQTERRRG
jgi:hypothetical protein